MSSSTFEVKEPEIESEKVLDFGLDACEENGLEVSTTSEGEVPKDHTYNKEPDVDEEGDKNSDTEETVDKMEETSPKKKGGRPAKPQKAERTVTRGRPKKEVAQKEPAAIKGKKKQDSTEESEPVAEAVADNAETQNTDETPVVDVKDTSKAVKEAPKPAKRGRKRKVEEKENVIDQSIVEEVQNITEDPTLNEATVESPTKKAKVVKEEKPPKPKKTPKPNPIRNNVVEDNTNLPKGWVRKLVTRQSGKSAGMIDVYIYSPEGLKFRSRPDVASYLQRIKSPLKLSDFDFSKKKSQNSTTNSAKSTVKTKTKPAKPKVEKKKPQPQKKKTKLVVAIARKKKEATPKKVAKSTKASKAANTSKGAKATKGKAKASKTPVKTAKASKTPVKTAKASKTPVKTAKAKTPIKKKKTA